MLSDDACIHLVEQALASGVWHEFFVACPYDELADFPGPDDYQTWLRSPPQPSEHARRGQAKRAARVQTRAGPGPGYEHETDSRWQNATHRDASESADVDDRAHRRGPGTEAAPVCRRPAHIRRWARNRALAPPTRRDHPRALVVSSPP
jgi:hypothetical protein